MRTQLKINEIEELLMVMKKAKPKIIGIDGECGSGKTTLIAKKISNLLNTETISLDEFLPKNKKNYFCPNMLLVKKKIDNIKSNKPIIIEGILLLQLIETIDIKLDYLIYVTRGGEIYKWEEDGPYSGREIEEIIKEEEIGLRKMSELLKSKFQKMSRFYKDIFFYNYKYKPFFKADVIYTNIFK